MPQLLKAGLPPNLDLSDGYIIRLNAYDANFGFQIAGVAVSEMAIYVRNLAGTDFGADGPVIFVPYSAGGGTTV